MVKKIIASLATLLLSVIVVILSSKGYCFEAYTVEGSSMEPTIMDGSWLVVNTQCKQYVKGDIVIASIVLDNKNLLYCKRILALEGDHVEIRHGHFFVNNHKTDFYSEGHESATWDVPKESVFLLGDNIDVSRDSRDPSIGFVNISDLVGKVVSY